MCVASLKLNNMFCFQEPRVPIRLLLLKVFGVLCGLDRTIIGILLASVLPNELGRDIQQDMKGGRGSGWNWKDWHFFPLQ